MNDIRKQINHRLCSLGKGIQNTHISDLLNKDCEKRVIQNDLLNFDYSKQRINDQIIDYLLQIPDLIDLDDSLRLLFNGEAYNPSEDRLVSHTIYRNKNFTENFELIFKERERITSFVDLAGHEKYLKTTVYGITGLFVD